MCYVSPVYGRFTGFYVNGFLSCKTRGLHRRDVTHILSKVSCFYWNPFIFVGYRNDRFFSPYKSLYFECYATTPKLADAHISSLGYLWVIWLLYHFVMTSTAFHFPWLTSRTLYKKKQLPLLGRGTQRQFPVKYLFGEAKIA